MNKQKRSFLHSMLWSIMAIVLSSCSTNDISNRTMRDLVDRVLPANESKHFVFESIDAAGNDQFELSTKNDKILIKGNNPIAMASGINWYLKYYCNSSVSWSGNQIKIPDLLPQIDGTVTKQSAFEHAYYLNYCTFNYTMSFWDWERWEKEIDWMALNGINLPLAITGTEAVWYNVLKRFGYSDEDILKFIPGPAFTSWWLMTNLEGWGGPVSKEYIDQQVVLQQKILKRMRDYGMNPVLPGFYGMVPNNLKEKYPNADIRDQGLWAGGFRRPAFLLPTDPLFSEIAHIFYEEQKKLFGATEYFSGDPFHEGGSTEGIDLPAAGENLISSVKKVYPNAKWVFQAWHANPRLKLLSRIKGDDILILDLDADNNPQWSKTNAWDNKNWIWSSITNYGGNVGMFGRLDVINTELLGALKKHPKSLKGIGVMPEAIENNPVIYEFLYEFRWRDASVNMQDWLANFAHRRYGHSNANLNKAWAILNETVYGKKIGHPGQQGTNESIFCARPSLHVTQSSSWGTTAIHYNPKKLLGAWNLFVKESNDFKDSPNFQYDLVDITRQVLANYAQVLYANMIQDYQNKEVDAFMKSSKLFTELLLEQNELLNTNKNFMLGPWLEAAKSRGTNAKEKALFEYNARVQVTTWSFQDSDLHDYSHREWGGMLSDFYLPRWKMFISKLKEDLKGEDSDAIDYYSFEEGWNNEQKIFPVTPKDDGLRIVYALYDKYFGIINQSYP